MLRCGDGGQLIRNTTVEKQSVQNLGGRYVLMPNFANPYPKAHEEESPIKSKAQILLYKNRREN